MAEHPLHRPPVFAALTESQRRAWEHPPQPEGNPAMQGNLTEEPKDQRVLPGRLAHVEDLITEIDNDVHNLHR